MGLGIRQLHCCSPERLPGGVIIPRRYAGMAQQETG
jgi:hypothetical protein